MARTESTMLELGTPLPAFELLDPVTGNSLSDQELRSRRATVVMFICNHCPYVQRIRDGIAKFGHDYASSEVGIVAISSNDSTAYPDDSPDKMKEEVERFGYSFPYLFDEDQSVAKAFRAACTPEFYVFDGNHQLAYRGQFDSARPGNDTPSTGEDVRAALDAILSQTPVSADQTPSLGCNIKWKAGNAPDYFG